MRNGLIILLSPIIGGTFLAIVYDSFLLPPEAIERLLPPQAVEHYHVQYFLMGYVQGFLFTIWCVWLARAQRLSPSGRILAGLCIWVSLFAVGWLYFTYWVGEDLFSMMDRSVPASFVASALVCCLILPGLLTGFVAELAMAVGLRARHSSDTKEV